MELEFQQLCKLAGFTVEEANAIGYCRAELLHIINSQTLKLAA